MGMWRCHPRTLQWSCFHRGGVFDELKMHIFVAFVGLGWVVCESVLCCFSEEVVIVTTKVLVVVLKPE